jgi:hypothetical protein
MSKSLAAKRQVPAQTQDIRPLSRTPEEYWKAVWDHLNEYMPLMEECWYFKPDLRVEVEARLMVTVDFDLKDLPHNGRRFFINPDNEDRDTPEQIARFTVEEVYQHKAVCKECGDGSMSIQDRLHAGVKVPPDGMEEILFPVLAKKLRKLCQQGKRDTSRISSRSRRHP